jgi:hypothetical protein
VLLLTVVLSGSSLLRAAGPVTYYVSRATGVDDTCAAAQSSGTPAYTIGFAVTCANTDTTNGDATAANPDIINIAAGTYIEHSLFVNAHVDLVGATGAVIDGNQNGKIMTIGLNDTVGIYNLTLFNGGDHDSPGGAIFIRTGSTVRIGNSRLLNNTLAYGSFGGAIFNQGTLTISDTTISGNVATGGGGVWNSLDGTLTINRTTFSGNLVSLDGGALANEGTLTVSNSTFSGNSVICYSYNPCAQSGGAVLSDRGGTATITNSTIVGNTQNLSTSMAGSVAGVIGNTSGTVRLRGTIIASNTTNLGGNCTGTITDEGYNLEDTTPSTCGFSSANNDIVGSDPKLGLLQNNGGPTQTMALAVDSPAIDKVPADVDCPATDQRGVPRPIGPACDIGSYERGFLFTGFLAPVDNPNTFNFVKAGGSVPVKFQLGGNQGLDIIAAGSPTSRQIVCDSNAVLDPITTTETAGGSRLSYDATTQTYTYVWKTEKAWGNSCRELTLTLSDGTVHAALFNFWK